MFEEKFELLLNLRDREHLTWSGRFRPPLVDQGVLPRARRRRTPATIARANG